jgi:diadenosine tetraphosphate (Ap4A) HIT family hydrolase
LASFADFAKTRKALDSCPFCYQDDNPPRAAVVALGNRTYIACTQNEELVEGHCLIVPIQHHLSMLELEDDDWEEVKVRRSRAR